MQCKFLLNNRKYQSDTLVKSLYNDKGEEKRNDVGERENKNRPTKATFCQIVIGCSAKHPGLRFSSPFFTSLLYFPLYGQYMCLSAIL